LYRTARTQHQLNRNVINIKTTATTIRVPGEFQTIPDPFQLKEMEIWEGGRNRPPLFWWSELTRLGLCEKEIT